MKIGDQPISHIGGMTFRQLLIMAAVMGIGWDVGGMPIPGVCVAEKAVERADEVLKILDKEVADAKSKVR